MDRRGFLQRIARGSVLTLSYKVAGSALTLTPAQARARAVPLRQLDDAQAVTLERLGEALLPGSASAGLVHFIDHQLGVPPNDCLLIAKYFQVPLPYRAFYAGGAAAAEKLARERYGRSLVALDDAAADALAGAMSVPGTRVEGFDAFLFYLCLRSDAVDVVYGTPQGFAKLGIPYMEHILPPEGWDG